MYGAVVMSVIGFVVTFMSTHSWVAGREAALLSLVLILGFSAVERFVRGLRSKS
ncbi:hypothetical protein GCM10027076_04780 [Nocardioides montaniterrae]